MIEESKYSELEAKIRSSQRKSWLRFFIFLGFILALWIGTYIVTKGQFSIFTKKIAVIDTLVINQDDALAARDSIIKDQKHLINLLDSQLAAISKPVLGSSAKVQRRIDTIQIINQRVIKHDIEIQRRDSVLRNIRQQYILPNEPLQIIRKK